MYRILSIFILNFVFGYSYANACESLWVDNEPQSNNKRINIELRKMSSDVNKPVVVTPKAIRTIQFYSGESQIINTLPTMNIARIKVIISEECDKDLIKNLIAVNLSSLNGYTLDSEKGIRATLSGAEINAFIHMLSKEEFCKIPIYMAHDSKDSIRTWIYAPPESPVFCADLPIILAIHGIKIINIDGKLTAVKA